MQMTVYNCICGPCTCVCVCVLVMCVYYDSINAFLIASVAKNAMHTSWRQNICLFMS